MRNFQFKRVNILDSKIKIHQIRTIIKKTNFLEKNKELILIILVSSTLNLSKQRWLAKLVNFNNLPVSTHIYHIFDKAWRFLSTVKTKDLINLNTFYKHLQTGTSSPSVKRKSRMKVQSIVELGEHISSINSKSD